MARLISIAKHAKSQQNFVEWFGLESDDGYKKIVPVVWIEYRVEANGVYLFTIETRPGYRNLGYATKALELLKDSQNVSEIRHNGSYTPEGLSYIYPKVTWVRDGFVDAPTADFKSGNYVSQDSWENYRNHLI